jgi:hypothetical protein
MPGVYLLTPSSLLACLSLHNIRHGVSAENLTAIHTLISRLDTGRWGDATDPPRLNQEAAQYGPTYNVLPPKTAVVPSAFVPYHPAVFLRPYDGRNLRQD